MMKTITSRDLNQDADAAKRAAQSGPVFITAEGRSTHVLLSIEEYRKLSVKGRNFVERIAMPGGDEIDFGPPGRDAPGRRDADLL